MPGAICLGNAFILNVNYQKKKKNEFLRKLAGLKSAKLLDMKSLPGTF